jgi:hypothetical protein
VARIRSPRPTRARRNIGARKVMNSVCFSRYGSHDMAILPPVERFNWNFSLDEALERYEEH